MQIDCHSLSERLIGHKASRINTLTESSTMIGMAHNMEKHIQYPQNGHFISTIKKGVKTLFRRASLQKLRLCPVILAINAAEGPSAISLQETDAPPALSSIQTP
jgi:hypothetical protein